MAPTRLQARLIPHLSALIPGLVGVALFVTWAVQNGGFDGGTWYWGALVLLATAVAVCLGLPRGSLHLSRPSAIALALLTLYVGWSYLSMTWAQYPGLALEGSNRALLYLLIFGLFSVLPWTRDAALAALLTFVIGIGVIAVVILFRLASDDNVGLLFVNGRLAAPTGYINSTAALFTTEALGAIALAARRGLPGPLRGLLLAFAGAGLQLAIVVESRGWLFTLPIVAVAAILAVKDRLRVSATAVIPVVAALIPARRLLKVYQSGPSDPLSAAAVHAARPALMLCAATFAVGTLVAWGDRLRTPRPLSGRQRRVLGASLAAVAIAGTCGAGLVVSNGHPGQFISRQWRGFSHQQTVSSGSHFTDVGSGRYDFWRVALDAVKAHPIGGLGQDNFADYYLTRRHTYEEPSWTHSLEMRLLAHTGLVGFALFAAFLIAAIAAAARVRRQSDAGTAALAGAMLLPLIVWLIHGSLDWFWEMPALTGPALGFLAAAGALAARSGPESAVARVAPAVDRPRPAVPAAVAATFAAVAIVGLTVVLAFPFLSTRDVSLALKVGSTNPTAALDYLAQAADFNPLSSDPGRVAGALALRAGSYAVAEQRFRQSISAQPGGWFAWLGAGLAASALGQRDRAHHDFAVAYSIDARQAAVQAALRRVYTRRPLTSAQAFKLLVLIH